MGCVPAPATAGARTGSPGVERRGAASSTKSRCASAQRRGVRDLTCSKTDATCESSKPRRSTMASPCCGTTSSGRSRSGAAARGAIAPRRPLPANEGPQICLAWCANGDRGTTGGRVRIRRRRGRRMGGRRAERRDHLRAEPNDPSRRRPRRVVGVVHARAAGAPRRGDLTSPTRGRRRLRARSRGSGDRGISGGQPRREGRHDDGVRGYPSTVREGGLSQGGGHDVGDQ